MSEEKLKIKTPMNPKMLLIIIISAVVVLGAVIGTIVGINAGKKKDSPMNQENYGAPIMWNFVSVQYNQKSGDDVAAAQALLAEIEADYVIYVGTSKADAQKRSDTLVMQNGQIMQYRHVGKGEAVDGVYASSELVKTQIGTYKEEKLTFTNGYKKNKMTSDELTVKFEKNGFNYVLTFSIYDPMKHSGGSN